jgi:hypothetical protein
VVLSHNTVQHKRNHFDDISSDLKLEVNRYIGGRKRTLRTFGQSFNTHWHEEGTGRGRGGRGGRGGRVRNYTVY